MLAVDRHRDRLTEIGAAVEILRAHGTERERFFYRSLAVHIRDPVLADDDLGVDALLVDVAEHFDNLADRTAGGRRPRRDFHHHHLSRFRRSRLAGRHVHVRDNAPIERLHKAKTGFRDIEAADDRGIAALEDANDPPLEPVLDRPALDAHEHAIAVHRLLDVGGRHIYVGRVAAGLVGNHEAEAGRVHLEAADHEVHLVGQPDTPALGLHELARRDERFQETAECGPFFLRNLERFRKLARRGRMRDLVTH